MIGLRVIFEDNIVKKYRVPSGAIGIVIDEGLESIEITDEIIIHVHYCSVDFGDYGTHTIETSYLQPTDKAINYPSRYSKLLLDASQPSPDWDE